MIGDDQQDQQGNEVDSPMVLGEDFTPPPNFEVNVDGSEDLLAAHISRARKTLFWVPVGVQDCTVWALIDTGASLNLIFQQISEAMPDPPTLRPLGSLMVVARNNQEIPLLGWITIRFTFNTRSAYHEFGVAKNLSLAIISGGEFHRPHESKSCIKLPVGMHSESGMGFSKIAFATRRK